MIGFQKTQAFFLPYQPYPTYTNTVIKSVKLVDRDRMELVIGLNHKSNFQNLELKNKRSKEFMLYLKEALTALNIKLSPPW